MIESYFFIPASKVKFLNKINTYKSDFFIVDMEDAVSLNDKKVAFDNVMAFDFLENTFVRIPFFDKCYSKEELMLVIQKFKGKVVVPKISTIADFEVIIDLLSGLNSFEMIVLVETPLCFINLGEILKKYHTQIYGIGFGSHDFCVLMDMKHDLEKLIHYKKELILMSKAYNIRYIDSVDTDLRNFTTFREECKVAYENGANGKFLIHPQQLQELESTEFLTQLEIEKNKFLYNKFKDLDVVSIEAINVDGEMYELPHIERVKRLYKKINR